MNLKKKKKKKKKKNDKVTILNFKMYTIQRLKCISDI